MTALIQFWASHGTKLLGFLGGSLGVVASTSGIIPDHYLKYCLLAIGLCTFWRGFTNTANTANSNANQT